MESPPEAVVAVRISLLLLLAVGTAAHAESIDSEIIGRQSAGLTSIDLRTAWLDQNGAGFQSVAYETPSTGFSNSTSLAGGVGANSAGNGFRIPV